jgi:acetyl esterase/lipase
MGILTRRVGLALAAGAGASWLAFQSRDQMRFYYRMFQAKRMADRFYTTCPTVYKNLPYQPGGPSLDIYRPDAGTGHPVFIYVYGGSWSSGHKEWYAPIAERLLPEGMVVVIPDYTLFPAARYPRQQTEIAAALAWTLDNIQNYGGDPSRVVVCAQSAGVHIAGLAVLDPRWLKAHGHSATELRGFVGLSGVWDIPAQVAHVNKRRGAGRYVEAVVGGRQNLAAASPLSYADQAGLPMMLIHGDADTTVPLSVSVTFYLRRQAIGAPAELLVYRGGGHSAILFDALNENPSRLVNDLVRFARTCTAQPVLADLPQAA